MAEVNRRTDLDAAMKVIFQDPIITNVVEDSEFLKFIQQDANVSYHQTTGGRYVELSHDFRKGGSVGARSEGDYIPVANKPVFKNSKIKLRKIQGSIEMTGDVMRRVRQDEGAFLNYMERALPDAIVRLVNSLDRQYIGTGFGVKSRVLSKGAGGSAAANYIVVDRALGVTGYSDAWKQYLEGDSIVFSASVAGTSLKTGGGIRYAIVSDIDEVNSRVYLEAAGGGLLNATFFGQIATDDYVFEGDAAGASIQDTADSEYREITGILGGIDDGSIVATYHGITRGVGLRLWNGLIVDSSSATLGFGSQMSEDLLVYSDEILSERGTGKASHVVMSRSANRGYWKSLKGDRVIQDPRGQYTGGKGAGLQIILGDRTVTLKVAKKMPPEVAFMMQADTWKRWGLGSFEWDDATGAIWNRATDATGRQDQFYAVGNLYEELGCVAPRKNLRIDGLTATA
jgi:hypothetical protein